MLKDFLIFSVIRVLFWELENYGSNWIRLHQIGSKGQIWLHWFKLLQTVLNCSWHGLNQACHKGQKDLTYFDTNYLQSWIDFQSCFYEESLKCEFYFVAIWMSFMIGKWNFCCATSKSILTLIVYHENSQWHKLQLFMYFSTLYNWKSYRRKYAFYIGIWFSALY